MPVSRPTLAGTIAATALALLALSFGASSAPAAPGVERAVTPEVPAKSEVFDTIAEASAVVAEAVGSDDPVGDVLDAMGRPERPPLRVSSVVTNPPDAAAEVGAALRRAFASACAEQAKGAESRLSGGPEASWNIRGGQVKDLVLRATESQALEECLLQTVRTTRFSSELDARVEQARWMVSLGSRAGEVLPIRDYGGY